MGGDDDVFSPILNSLQIDGIHISWQLIARLAASLPTGVNAAFVSIVMFPFQKSTLHWRKCSKILSIYELLKASSIHEGVYFEDEILAPLENQLKLHWLVTAKNVI